MALAIGTIEVLVASAAPTNVRREICMNNLPLTAGGLVHEPSWIRTGLIVLLWDTNITCNRYLVSKFMTCYKSATRPTAAISTREKSNRRKSGEEPRGRTTRQPGHRDPPLPYPFPRGSPHPRRARRHLRLRHPHPAREQSLCPLSARDRA